MSIRFPARHRAQIVLSDATVTLGAARVLNDVSLVVTPASRIAIVGENGRGKSTLLHVLGGTLTLDHGSVTRVGTLGLAEQEMSTADERTVRAVVEEAIAAALAALGELDAASAALADAEPGAEDRFAAALEAAELLDAWDAERRIQVALGALGVDAAWSRKLSELSVGQRYRVRLACLIGGDDDFLLLDEPTNHLDRSGLEFLTAQIASRSGGVVVVSHDRALLADVAETIIDLDPTSDGRARVYGGGFDGYLAGRRAERERWEQEFARQQSERARLHDDLSAAQNRQITSWRPDKGTGKHQRATRAGGLVQSVHRRQAALDAHAVTVPEPPLTLHVPTVSTRRGATLVTAEKLTVEGRLTSPVSVTLKGGARLLVTGPNGSGKSTLLGALAGTVEPSGGHVSRSTTHVAFVRQESELPLTRRASSVYAAHIDKLVAHGRIPVGSAVGLSSLGLLRANEASKAVGELSMGQRRRLDLALALASLPDVLLLDEPTNHLSIALVDDLIEALQATRAAVVLSTHDRQLLRDLANWRRLELPAELSPTG